MPPCHSRAPRPQCQPGSVSCSPLWSARRYALAAPPCSSPVYPSVYPLVSLALFPCLSPPLSLVFLYYPSPIFLHVFFLSLLLFYPLLFSYSSARAFLYPRVSRISIALLLYIFLAILVFSYLLVPSSSMSYHTLYSPCFVIASSVSRIICSLLSYASSSSVIFLYPFGLKIPRFLGSLSAYPAFTHYPLLSFV